jgi:putative copper export protein
LSSGRCLSGGVDCWNCPLPVCVSYPGGWVGGAARDGASGDSDCHPQPKGDDPVLWCGDGAILHTLGATVWTGGHLVLAVTILPQALKNRDPDCIQQFEKRFESFGLLSLLLQVITGLWLTWIYFPGFQNFLAFDSYLSQYIGIKLLCLLGTGGLAIHARFFIIPNLTKETLNFLAYHIVGVTILAVSFVVLGTGVRLGGLA